MRPALRLLGLMLLAAVMLELFFVGRIALMAVVAPESTSFQRSEAWRIATEKGDLRWRQQWVPYAQISEHLKRAVITSEDDGFTSHDGVDWEAIEKAWQKNSKAEEQAAGSFAVWRGVRPHAARVLTELRQMLEQAR